MLLLCVHAGVGHCMFQKYAAIAVAWLTVPRVGATCMPPAGADAAMCACGRVKAEQARVIPAAWASEPFFRRRVIQEVRELSDRAVHPDVRALAL